MPLGDAALDDCVPLMTCRAAAAAFAAGLCAAYVDAFSDNAEEADGANAL